HRHWLAVPVHRREASRHQYSSAGRGANAAVLCPSLWYPARIYQFRRSHGRVQSACLAERCDSQSAVHLLVELRFAPRLLSAIDGGPGGTLSFTSSAPGGSRARLRFAGRCGPGNQAKEQNVSDTDNIAIHGFGRIGRSTLKAALTHQLFVPLTIS